MFCPLHRTTVVNKSLIVINSYVFYIERSITHVLFLFFFTVVNDANIEELLNDSDFEFSGDDSDDDPAYLSSHLDPEKVPENDSDTDSTDSDDAVADTMEMDYTVPSPALSDGSAIPRTRGRSRGRGSRRG